MSQTPKKYEKNHETNVDLITQANLLFSSNEKRLKKKTKTYSFSGGNEDKRIHDQEKRNQKEVFDSLACNPVLVGA